MKSTFTGFLSSGSAAWTARRLGTKRRWSLLLLWAAVAALVVDVALGFGAQGVDVGEVLLFQGATLSLFQGATL